MTTGDLRRRRYQISEQHACLLRLVETLPMSVADFIVAMWHDAGHPWQGSTELSDPPAQLAGILDMIKVNGLRKTNQLRKFRESAIGLRDVLVSVHDHDAEPPVGTETVYLGRMWSTESDLSNERISLQEDGSG